MKSCEKNGKPHPKQQQKQNQNNKEKVGTNSKDVVVAKFSIH